MSYVPGACNIGGAEIALRRRSGWMGLGLTAVLEAVFILTGVAGPWRLFLFLPASLAAAGFLQAAFRFCAAYGLKGVFSFEVLGRTTDVADVASRAADRRKAIRLGAYSSLIGAAIALAGFLTA